MTLKFVLCALVVMLFSLYLPAQAQQPAKITKIGFLGTRPAPASGQRLWRELRELGLVEGKNLTIELRYADNHLDRLPALAEELVRLDIDVLVTPGVSETLAAKNATKTIPIVFYEMGTDPVAIGLIDSFSRPGGNITGFTNVAFVLAGKRLELLKETISKLSVVAVLWDPQNPGSAQQWKESQLSARDLGLQLLSVEVSSADKLESGIKVAAKTRGTALSVTGSALFNSHQKWIADLTTKNRLPAMYPRTDFVESGGLMSYGPDETERFRRAAALIDKILKGRKPAELPVEQPTDFALVINLKTAKQIGLTIPPNVLARADRVLK